MSDKIYLVQPGWVTSKNDGDLHYITAERLMDLYKVNPSECIIDHGRVRGLSETYMKGLIVLRPRRDGDYSLDET